MATKGEKLFYQRRFKEAIPLLASEVQRRKDDVFSIGPILTLGVAYLCNWNCKKAAQHLERIIKKRPRTSDSHYFFGGFSHWYAKNYSRAIELWKLGFKCQYSGSKSLDCRLALYFASITNPDEFSVDEAKHLLLERIRVIINKDDWPIPIASFLLGNISAETFAHLGESYLGLEYVVRTQRILAQARFYIGLRELEQGNSKAFDEACNTYVDTPIDYLEPAEFMLSHMELTK